MSCPHLNSHHYTYCLETLDPNPNVYLFHVIHDAQFVNYLNGFLDVNVCFFNESVFCKYSKILYCTYME